MNSNFAFLTKYEPEAARVGAQAEALLFADPRACVVRLGLLAEWVIRALLATEGLTAEPNATYTDRCRLLDEEGLLPHRIYNMFTAVRQAHHRARRGRAFTPEEARTLMALTFRLCCWLTGETTPEFVPPAAPDAPAEDAAPANGESAAAAKDTAPADDSNAAAPSTDASVAAVCAPDFPAEDTAPSADSNAVAPSADESDSAVCASDFPAEDAASADDSNAAAPADGESDAAVCASDATAEDATPADDSISHSSPLPESEPIAVTMTLRPDDAALDREARAARLHEFARLLTLSDTEKQYLAGRQVQIDASVVSVVNLALQLNRLPVVRSVTILNHSNHTLEQVTLRITSEPEFCRPFVRAIDIIPAGSAYDVRDVQLRLNAELLASLGDACEGELRFSLEKDGTPICSAETELTGLAFDQWQGFSFYPELLAAFVTPGYPEIAPLNARASELLEKWTDDPALDAYLTEDPNRVLAQAAAIYSALQEQNIAYVMPQEPRLDHVGYRVRMCDAVMAEKMGASLDLTLLYAACLEAVGLHPLLILKKNHIFAGVWLDALSFPDAVQDDPLLITRRLADGVNEIAVVECTRFAVGRQTDFDDACATAEQELRGDSSVEYIIDVHRARIGGIVPLPHRIRTDEGWQIDLPDDAEEPVPEQEPAVEPTGSARKLLWERKLLDLGLRNALINMRFSRTLVPILSTSLEKLEDALMGGSDFSVHPRPSDWTMTDRAFHFEQMQQLGTHAEWLEQEFGKNRLRSILSEKELPRAITELYRSARTAIEENGSNTLYLALGLLRWYENDRSAKPRYAPVLLLPVEMVRRSARQGYTIRLRDDDPQLNVTMLEKLKQDFQIEVPGLDPLPMAGGSIALQKVFAVLRRAVADMRRWDVLESAYLGIFSFSQFVMWNDLRNRSDALAQNKIVRSLLDGKLAWDAEDMQLGARVPEENVLLPIPADASQLFAIEAACSGESFVLHGPPGTGKSQTITALIANALAQGKTVLFVAEKMAALEVVQKRLEAIGIGPFCLELHSNKSKKKAVLAQLSAAASVTRARSSEAYAIEAERMAALRAELDGYAAGLHRTLPCGRSVYDLINHYEKYRSAPDIGRFPSDWYKKLTQEAYEQQKVLVNRLIAAGRAVGHPHDHPLQMIGCTQYSQQLRHALPDALEADQAALAALQAAYDALAPAVDYTGDSFAGLSELAARAEELALWVGLPRAWAQSDRIRMDMAEVQEMSRHFRHLAELRGELMQRWKPEFLTAQNGAALRSEFTELSGKWLLPRLMGMRGLTRRMALYWVAPVPREELLAQFTLLASYQAEKAVTDALWCTHGPNLGALDRGEQTDWTAVEQSAGRAAESAARLYDRCGSDRFRMRFCALPALTAPVRAFHEAWQALQAPHAALVQLLALPEDKGDGWIARQQAQCESIAAHADELKEWITWNAVADEANRARLRPVVKAYRAGLAHEDVAAAFRKALDQALIIGAVDANPQLNRFSGVVFNEQIAQLRRMDRRLTLLTRREIYCRLAAKVPDFAREAAQSSELGILQRAIRSGGRGVSIRRLFDQIPNLLPRLCPCMLMSPISAAQYLDPNREPFSLVVFDEASQLQTCKAVGALARGRDAVIVGDPKQMPPTSFFASSTMDEESDVEDLESILDDCLALNMPQTHLLWHYRSRHESLIAFSNSRFYDNKLYTFPSVNDRESKVRLVHVDGTFDRGRTRCNRAEAEAIVAELQRRAHDETLRGLSVGVVTFNMQQQDLIEDLLNDACSADPALESWAYGGEEPLFIKNLENVQGDERDAILFSVSYGPDENGRVYMNFGPLNRDGGWRRLNVAISRARCEMTVYATLTPDQIDLSKTNADGVAALKAFLEYAGGGALPQNDRAAHYARAKQGVADAICAAIHEEGYATEQQVGHSEYRIDIGVIDPDHPGRYVLGILLDGPQYAHARTTRDRELAQIDVLRGLGWSILRVWTMDWWDNRKKELQRIIRALRQGVPADEPEEELPTLAQLLAEPEPAPDDGDESDGAADALSGGDESADTPLSGALVYTPVDVAELGSDADDELQAAAEKFTDGYSLVQYHSTHLSPAVQARVRAVLAQEAPISGGRLSRLVAQSLGVTRFGSRILYRMDVLFTRMKLKSTTQGNQKFYWRDDQDPDTYADFRTTTGDDKRDPHDVPVQEAANAICRVLVDQVSLAEPDLLREAARCMGYTRFASSVSSLFSRALEYAQQQGRVARAANGNWIKK